MPGNWERPATVRSRVRNPRQRVATAAVGDRTIPTVLPPGSGKSPQKPTLNQLAAPPAQINGTIHGQADVADWQELQVEGSGFGHADNFNPASSALVAGGQRQKLPATTFLPSRARPNPSLKRRPATAATV